MPDAPIAPAEPRLDYDPQVGALDGWSVSEREYLASSYEPDRDYADGRLVERNVGEYDHSRLETLLAVLLGNLENSS